MRLPKFALLATTLVGFASSALANGRNPGSLLLFPEFDNRHGNLTLLTVTNTNTGVNPDGSSGTIKVEFIYIGRYGSQGSDLNCLETNRTETLTANDTISVLTSFHNPNHEQGYVYVFAKDVITGRAEAFNYLTGQVLTLESWEQVEYSINAMPFLGFGSANGETDVDNDGIRDLDGVEYEPVPDEMLIPRFIGAGGDFHSELILIGLSGGVRFNTIANFWIYNDNEEVFSAQREFHCWDRVRIRDINGVFTQEFLRENTNHAPGEIIGATNVETGWIRVYGGIAYSTAETIEDPAIVATLVERIDRHGAADLAFDTPATQNNGDLLPHGIFGDPSGGNGDNQ
jgi:hypothetical protein